MRLPRILTVLALIGFSLACGGIGGEEEVVVNVPEPEPVGQIEHDYQPQDPWTAYAESRYDYCDAKILAGMWGTDDIGSAKENIGRYLLDSEGELLEQKLSWAREGALSNPDNRALRCNWQEIGFSYDDAVALGEYWGIDSWDAKLRIEDKYLMDAHSDVHIRAALAEARGEQGDHYDPHDAYINSRFEYCDALVLSGFWGGDVWDTKHKIGVLVTENSEDYVAGILSTAQRAAADNIESSRRCEYDDIGYSYGDADLLADYWGISTWDAKLRIEEKYLRDGHERTHIDEALRLARGG